MEIEDRNSARLKKRQSDEGELHEKDDQRKRF